MHEKTPVSVYLEQFDTDAYKIDIAESEKIQGKDVYVIVNKYTGILEAETSILPEAIKVVTDWTEMLTMPSDILVPPKQDIVVSSGS